MTEALVPGASGGIGAAVCAELQARGWRVTPLSRSGGGFDLTDEASVAAAAATLAARRFDLIFVATGALEIDGARPEKTIAAIGPQVMAAQFALNALGPALALKHFSPLLAADGRFVALSARIGSISDNRLGGWISYRAAKAALNQIIRTAAIEIARRDKQAVVAALHPGTVATPLTARYAARHPAIAPAEAASHLVDTALALTPEQSGGFFDNRGAPIGW